ncbi:MAG TPA: sulfotransferase [Stellaceae bacterium]|nr:sulfotransferase [Stellaceae bacterium]
MKLDFVIIGAEKSGTTLLVELLRRSPQVAMPKIEVRYFRDPFYPERERSDVYFDAEDSERLKRIKHPSYLGRPEVPGRIKEHSPNAKLVAILRDPVARTLASYLHYIRHGQIPCLHPNIGISALFADPHASPKYGDIISFGYYSKFLGLYLDLFRREQILVIELEEFIRTPTGLRDLFAFLGVTTRPAGLWPLPLVNSGDYNWGRCQQAHYEARHRLVYDESANIIGIRRDAVPVPRCSFDRQSCELSPEVRALVAQCYAGECEALRNLGLLHPRHW